MKLFSVVVAFLLALTFVGCGGSNFHVAAGPSLTASVTITTSTSSANVVVGGSMMFAATVYGSSNIGVTWSVQEGSAGGTVDATGKYTAPSTPGTYHIIVTSMADSTKTAVITVTVVAVTPPRPISMNVDIGGFCNVADMRQITQAYVDANVTMSDGTTRANDVKWTIQEGGTGGSIAQTGTGTLGQPLFVYTAGTTLGTFHLGAVSNADPTVTGTVTVTVIPLTLSVSPIADILPPSGKRTIRVLPGPTPILDPVHQTLACMGSNYLPPIAVNVAEGSAGGTVVPTTGLNFGNFVAEAQFAYAAPAQTGTYHLTVAARDLPSVSVPVTISVANSGYFTSSGPFPGTDLEMGAAAVVGLNDGTVLIAGGGAGVPSSLSTPVAFPSAGILHPAADGSVTFTTLPNMNAARADAGVVKLKDGRVLIAGGGVPSFAARLTSAELFDPASGTFTLTGSMHVARAISFASLLPDGRAIVVGYLTSSPFQASAEIYDPATGTFGNPISLAYALFASASTMLPNGKILFAGGSAVDGSNNNTSDIQTLDPLTGVYTKLGSLTLGRTNACAAILPDGRVLIAGGAAGSSSSPGITNRAEVFDPATGTVTRVGDMTVPRSNHSCTTMADGKVLITGGWESGLNALRTAEVFDPATGTFSVTGGREFFQYPVFPVGVPLPGGTVLVTDGYPNQGVDVYHP